MIDVSAVASRDIDQKGEWESLEKHIRLLKRREEILPDMPPWIELLRDNKSLIPLSDAAPLVILPWFDKYEEFCKKYEELLDKMKGEPFKEPVKKLTLDGRSVIDYYWDMKKQLWTKVKTAHDDIIHATGGYMCVDVSTVAFPEYLFSSRDEDVITMDKADPNDKETMQQMKTQLEEHLVANFGSDHALGWSVVKDKHTNQFMFKKEDQNGQTHICHTYGEIFEIDKREERDRNDKDDRLEKDNKLLVSEDIPSLDFGIREYEGGSINPEYSNQLQKKEQIGKIFGYLGNETGIEISAAYRQENTDMIDETILELPYAELYDYTLKQVKLQDPTNAASIVPEELNIENEENLEKLRGIAKKYMKKSTKAHSGQSDKLKEYGNVLGISSHKLSMIGSMEQESSSGDIIGENTSIGEYLKSVAEGRTSHPQELLSHRYMEPDYSLGITEYEEMRLADEFKPSKMLEKVERTIDEIIRVISVKYCTACDEVFYKGICNQSHYAEYHTSDIPVKFVDEVLDHVKDKLTGEHGPNKGARKLLRKLDWMTEDPDGPLGHVSEDSGLTDEDRAKIAAIQKKQVGIKDILVKVRDATEEDEAAEEAEAVSGASAEVGDDAVAEGKAKKTLESIGRALARIRTQLKIVGDKSTVASDLQRGLHGRLLKEESKLGPELGNTPENLAARKEYASAIGELIDVIESGDAGEASRNWEKSRGASIGGDESGEADEADEAGGTIGGLSDIEGIEQLPGNGGPGRSGRGGFEIIKMFGDGSCLYRSVAVANDRQLQEASRTKPSDDDSGGLIEEPKLLQREKDAAMKLRGEVADYMRDNWAIFEHAYLGKNMEDVTERIRVEGEAEESEIRALSIVTNRKIFIHDCLIYQWKEPYVPDDEKHSPIYLSYNTAYSRSRDIGGKPYDGENKYASGHYDLLTHGLEA